MTVSPYINLILKDVSKRSCIKRIAEQHFECTWQQMTENQKEPYRTYRCMLYAIMQTHYMGVTEAAHMVNRTHASAINGLKRHYALLQTDDIYKRDFERAANTFQRLMPKHVKN